MWDHRLEHLASKLSMVTEDYVGKKLRDKGFVKYIFNNARLMSNTTMSSSEKIKRDPSNIFHHIHASDTAYVVI